MKRIFAIFALLLTLTATAFADDVTYTATLTGIDCTECKRTIATSIGKIKGVKTIRIEKASGDKHKMTVITDGSKPITKADAQKALKKAEHYQITSWSKAG